MSERTRKASGCLVAPVPSSRPPPKPAPWLASPPRTPAMRHKQRATRQMKSCAMDRKGTTQCECAMAAAMVDGALPSPQRPQGVRCAQPPRFVCLCRRCARRCSVRPITSRCVRTRVVKCDDDDDDDTRHLRQSPCALALRQRRLRSRLCRCAPLLDEQSTTFSALANSLTARHFAPVAPPPPPPPLIPTLPFRFPCRRHGQSFEGDQKVPKAPSGP